MQKFPVTKNGYERMEAELKRLKFEDRPAVIAAIAEARAHGDLSENAEYHAAREKQSFIEGRIQDLEARIAHAEIVDVAALSGARVVFGAQVKLIDCDNEVECVYQIVGEYEANIEEGKVSHASPVARALIGKETGDTAEVHTPSGKRLYEILEVLFDDKP